MTRSEVRAAIAGRERDFAAWFFAAERYAEQPPHEIRDWSELPPHPKHCYVGHSLTKTTALIPPEYHGRRNEFLLRLAEAIYGYAHILYADTIRLVYDDPHGWESETHSLGIVKKVGSQLAIYWFSLSLDANLVQVECRYSIYSCLAGYPDHGKVERGNSDAAIDALLRWYHAPITFFRNIRPTYVDPVQHGGWYQAFAICKSALGYSATLTAITFCFILFTSHYVPSRQEGRTPRETYAEHQILSNKLNDIEWKKRDHLAYLNKNYDQFDREWIPAPSSRWPGDSRLENNKEFLERVDGAKRKHREWLEEYEREAASHSSRLLVLEQHLRESVWHGFQYALPAALVLTCALAYYLANRRHINDARIALTCLSRDLAWDFSLGFYHCLARDKETLLGIIAQTPDHSIFIDRMEKALGQFLADLEARALG